MIAELKMHICDEHSHKQTKKRLKRVFQVRTNAEIAAAAAAAAAAATTATTTTTAAAAVTVVAGPGPSEPLRTTIATDSHQSPSSRIASIDPELSENNDGRLHTSNSFRSMIERHSRMVDDDNTDCEPVRSAISLTPIQSLFDFSRSHWVEIFARSTIRSFDEELKLYEMLDLDAEGDEDIDIDVDDDTGDILLG